MVHDILFAILFGILEGVTEWLPISSTGHMILAERFLSVSYSDPFRELFFVLIQLGAIMAVPTLYFQKINPFSRQLSKDDRKGVFLLWKKVFIAVLPASLLGLLLDDFIDRYLMNGAVVCSMLIVWGVLFILVENRKNPRFPIENTNAITRRTALEIGLYQTFSLIPGTSRSGATILGGMLLGVGRSASAEFSFFLAIPVMLGASLLKTVKIIFSGYSLTSPEILTLLLGILVSYLTSLVCIRFLSDFVKKQNFTVFGIYRIILGIIVLLYYL